MSVRSELQAKLDLLEELQRRLENREDGFARFEIEELPKEELEAPSGALEREGFSSLERVADLFTGFRADDIWKLPDTRRIQFRSLMERTIRLLEDARHFDQVRDLARDSFTDKANFIQAAGEIYEDIPEELLTLLGEMDVREED
ncbi:MAG: hypothetical protein ACE5GA_11715 [Candidatus Zixiibacteriota bacterium]